MDTTQTGGGLGASLRTTMNTRAAAAPLPTRSADQEFADLTRDMWANYMRTTVPMENRLISYSNDPGVVSRAMAEASGDARQAFANRSAALQRGLRAQGLTLDADEQRVVDRTSSLAGSLADVNAQNTARDVTRARQQSILGNPSPSTQGASALFAQGRG